MSKFIQTKLFCKKLLECLSLIILMGINTWVSAQCPGTDVIQNPVEFQWTYHPVTANNPNAYYSGVMEVGEHTFTFNNGETFTTRAYRQKGGSYSIPGPTIRMTPGNKYVLKLHNTLPYQPLNPSHNVFKDPNVVNIHTHGLHISGESPGDDVTRAFEGGRGGDFVWDIPADHMGGTFWYHAHHHGSTLLQVAGGMFGMIVIDDANDGLPQNVADMKEKVLAIGFVDPAVQGTGGDNILSGSLSPTWTVNGVIGGNLCLPENEWQHWRVLIADRGAKLRDVEFGPGVEVKVLARDGVWRTEAPKDLTTNKLQLTGASRADFAIRMPSAGTSWIKVGGNIVANINTNNDTPDLTANPHNTDGVSPWYATRPSYLRNLLNEPNVNNVSISMGARTVKGPDYGGKFDHTTPNVTLGVTDVQEWSLSGNVQHPFHLHVYHVQATEDDRDFEAGEYYDVVASQMDVRFDLNAATSTPYYGKTIMHCHILAHEDQGAMGWMQVTGGVSAPTFPADGDLASPYADYYVLNANPPAAASGLSGTAVSSSAIDLAWTDNSNDEDGFHIERSTDGINFSFIGSVGADVTSYNDNGLSASTIYYYQVTAFNAAGSAAPSNVANDTTFDPPLPPAAASALGATASSSSAIDLAWTDNANNEDGFNIERSTDGVNFSALTSVGANVTSYTDNGLNASTTYFYQVIAYNTSANSAASNIANATTDPFSGPSVHVEDIVVSREALNGNRWRGAATVTIHDGSNAVVSGATVNVSYSGPNSGTRSGTTNSNGEVSFTTNGLKNPSGEWCFEVTSVTLTGAVYNDAANSVTIACESGPQARKVNLGANTKPKELAASIGEARLLGVFPNPAQNQAQILFQVSEKSHVTIAIYSLIGDHIGILTDQDFEAGQHLFRLNAESMHGGAYFIQFNVGEKVETRKLVIVR